MGEEQASVEGGASREEWNLTEEKRRTGLTFPPDSSSSTKRTERARTTELIPVTREQEEEEDESPLQVKKTLDFDDKLSVTQLTPVMEVISPIRYIRATRPVSPIVDTASLGALHAKLAALQ